MRLRPLVGLTLLLCACSDDPSTPEATGGGAAGTNSGGAAGSRAGSDGGGKAGASGGAAGASGSAGKSGGQAGTSAGSSGGGAGGTAGGGAGGAGAGAAGESGVSGASGSASGAAGAGAAGEAGVSGAGGQGPSAEAALRSHLASSHHQSCALLDTGKVRCWGDNVRAGLGYGLGATFREPAELGVVPVGAKVAQLSLRNEHTCARLASGAVRCWGDNLWGQLGYGNKSDIVFRQTLADIGDVDVGGQVVQLSAGDEHTCARLATGSVRCWGKGYDGELGYGNNSTVGDDETPASAGDVPVGGKVTQISAGTRHTCAVLDTGTVRCWGSSLYGQLGYGNSQSIGDKVTPASAGDVPVGGKVTQIAVGDAHTCAVLDTGALRCWGDGDNGKLGYGTTQSFGDDEAPSKAGDVPVGGKVVQVSAGAQHTCAVLDTGALRCWGQDHLGQLGYGTTQSIGDDETPASAGDVPVGGKVVEVVAAGDTTCARLDTGTIRCWGDNSLGQLGHGNGTTIGDDETPASAGDVPIGGKAVQVVLGRTSACALLESGEPVCWGLGAVGNVRYKPSAIGDDEPASALGDLPLGGSAVSLSGGDGFTCAALDTGAVRCWGNGIYGQFGLGYGQHIGDDEPASAGDVPVGGKAVQVGAGSEHACALLDTGAVRCWGNGDNGVLGYGTSVGLPNGPSSDVEVGGKAVQISVGYEHTCALLASRAVRCWGNGGEGRLGHGDTSSIGTGGVTPASAGDVPVGGKVVQVSAGGQHTCAVLDTGALRCWGDNSRGQLGLGNTENFGDGEPASAGGDVPVGGKVVRVSAGGQHTCAVLDTGALRCWGDNSRGQLGLGNTENIGDNEPASAGGDVPVGGKVVEVNAGDEHTCAVLDTGALRCWGDGFYGQLGHGDLSTIGDDETPASAGDVPVGAKVMLPGM